MITFIEPTDELLADVDIDQRPAWISAAVDRLLPLLQRATFTTITDLEGVERPEPPAQDIIRRAIGTQIRSWLWWEIDPTSSAQQSRAQASVSLGPATINYDYRDDHAAQSAQARDGIDPTAAALLRSLIRQPVY